MFGEPLRSEFEYVVEATAPDGHKWILTIYDGQSGLAIGGDVSDPTIQAAANELLLRISDSGDHAQ